MSNQVDIPLYNEIVNGFHDVIDMGETEALQNARQKGFDDFRKLGFPTRKSEDWKYTSITPFLNEPYHVTETLAEEERPVPQQALIAGLDCYQLLTVNGKLQTNGVILPSFIKLRTIREAQQDAALIKYFAKTTDTGHAHFAALNTALFSDGFFIEIDANAIADKPLHIVHLFTSERDVMVQPRHLVVVHQSASLKLIESMVSEDQSSKIFINSLMEVVIKENASFDHYVLQTAKRGTRLIHQTDVSQRRHSLYNNYNFSMPGSELIRNNLNVSLDDDQTETHLFGLYLGAGDQLIDNHSVVNHKKPNCNSNEIYKGVLLDRSTGVFNGKIFVQHDAQKTNAFQQNNNLLLSKEASINSKPQLEIFADDVKCSHGSTVGQLSREALFYLRSRGISEDAATALLVNAFAFDVTEKIKINELKKHVNHMITQQIPVNKK
jgi:Fe-S cluster assembly protein SufD